MDHKIFNDFVHGHMSFHPLLVNIIDTQQLQRLRNIKQLGLVYYVYPSACHNRFEHSLGTCHLAKKLVEALNRNAIRNRWRITEVESLCVQVAALCHDLGHGPFSHEWEKIMDEIDPGGDKWNHEAASVDIFESILNTRLADDSDDDSGRRRTIRDEFKANQLHGKEIEMIKNMILGEPDPRTDRLFLYQIVSNSSNDIDVDKWDYLLRDQKMLNIPINFDHNRLLEYCKILPVGDKLHITYRKKEVMGILDMFMTRASLHHRAYQHQVVMNISLMLCDAMVAAHNCLLNNTIFDLVKLTKKDKLTQLTDHIYYEILYSTNSEMNKARNILTRIENRLFYRLVTVCKITQCTEDVWKKLKENGRWKTELINVLYEILKNDRNNNEISVDDIGVTLIHVNMGKCNTRGQFRNIYVYDKNNAELVTENTPLVYPHTLTDLLQCQPTIMILYKGPGARKFDDVKETIDCAVRDFFKQASNSSQPPPRKLMRLS